MDTMTKILAVIVYIVASLFIIFLSSKIGMEYGTVAQIPFWVIAFIWGLNCRRLINWMSDD
jgi:hypothetical protein